MAESPQNNLYMISITVRFPEENVAYVRRAAKARRVDDAQIWRELVDKGIYQHHAEEHRLRTILNLTVRTLSAVNRMAERVDPSIIEIAEQDAREAPEMENIL